MYFCASAENSRSSIARAHTPDFVPGFSSSSSGCSPGACVEQSCFGFALACGWWCGSSGPCDEQSCSCSSSVSSSESTSSASRSHSCTMSTIRL